MSAPNTMMIDNVKYVREDSVRTSCDSGPKDLRIIILPRGWVLVGEYKKTGSSITINNGSIIRNWGTTQGLGQIAKDGPTKDTKLDPLNGEFEVHELSVIGTLKCEAKKW